MAGNQTSTIYGQSDRVALQLLYSARRYALETAHPFWQFALEIAEMKQFGLSRSEFRWLLASGFAEHAEEVTPPNARVREFQPLGRYQFPDSTCFVLTETGAEFVESESGRISRGLESDLCCPPIGISPAINYEKPSWDAEQRELLFQQMVIKRFRRPAPNQELVLDVFQEEGWPRRIDDPLPNPCLHEPSQRLHDTIKCLNRNQVSSLIRFRGDGTGEGVVWEFTT